MDRSSPLLVVPTVRSERWRLIHELLKQWFPDAEYNRRVPLGNAAPAPPPTACPALIEWFEFVRESPNVWCRQDGLFKPHGYTLGGDFLIIGIENQSCAFWGVRRADLAQDDPPVFVDSDAHGNWVEENSSTSEFAVTWLASSIKFSERNRCWANGATDVTTLRIVEENYPRLGLPEWHRTVMPTRFYGTADLLLEAAGDEDYVWFFVSTRTRAAFDAFERVVKPAGISWDASSEDWPDGWVNSAEDLQPKP